MTTSHNDIGAMLHFSQRLSEYTQNAAIRLPSTHNLNAMCSSFLIRSFGISGINVKSLFSSFGFQTAASPARRNAQARGIAKQMVRPTYINESLSIR